MVAEAKIIRLSSVYLEAKRANRWDPNRECYLDQYGNIAIDDKTIDIEAIIQEYKEEDDYWQKKWWGDEEEKKKKKELIDEIERNSEKISLDEFIELVNRVREGITKIEESKKDETSKCEVVCSKCEKSEADSVKLLKDVESLTLENNTLKNDDEQIQGLRLNYEKLRSDNDKLLKNLESLLLENKIFKKLENDFKSQMKILQDERDIFGKNNLEKQSEINSHLAKIIQLEHEAVDAQKKIAEFEKDFESKRKSSESEDFWIKLENKNLKENETRFQEQLKVLENEKSVLENFKIENEKSIKSYLERISQLENEAENSRIKIDELETKLKGFVTSSDRLNFPCPKPINSVPISDKVTNFDKVKIEDCDGISDDEKEKKRKIFLDLQEKFKNTVLQSTEKGECSMQKPVKKNVKQKQKDKNLKNPKKENKSSSDQSSNHFQKSQKVKNENSQNVGNKWCRFDHSAQMPNPTNMRKEYHKATQCYDLSVWYENDTRYEREKRYDNRVCYSCGYQGHIAVNCQSRNFETRRCYDCQIRGHIARDCPRRSTGRSRVESQRMAKKPVNVKPKELKVSEQKAKAQKVQEPKVQETKVKLSQGQKDKLRKKRKKAREYLERILSPGSSVGKNKSTDESVHSTAKSSKPSSSDANLRTKKKIKKKVTLSGNESVSSETKEPHVGDESDRSKSDKPHSGNDSGSSKPEEPSFEVKLSKSPKAGQAWVNLFK
ncbi:putative transcription factor interactor and regulator CCHC(Zn) family [Helianthus anomalus]